MTGVKDKLDRFYTKPEIVDQCLKVVKYYIKDCKVIEPSAGEGAFSSKMVGCIALDISPTNDAVTKCDWLNVDIGCLTDEPKLAIVGNPPFGARNSLSKQFVMKCLSDERVGVIAFILPNSWNKPTLQKVFPRSWRLKETINLPVEAFIFEDKDYKVPCTFQVWCKDISGVDLRWEENPPISCEDFEFTSRPEDAHLFMMGAAPGVIKLVKDVDSNNRGYYIKVKDPLKNLLVVKDKISCIDWDKYGQSTAGGGVYWMTKPEIIKAYKLEEE